jgi:hypothetical protein
MDDWETPSGLRGTGPLQGESFGVLKTKKTPNFHVLLLHKRQQSTDSDGGGGMLENAYWPLGPLHDCRGSDFDTGRMRLRLLLALSSEGLRPRAFVDTLAVVAESV